MASTSETSITRTAAINFVRTASADSELSCRHIKGFYLRKTHSRATWYLRYTNFEGKRRKLNLGQFIDGGKDRVDAARRALEHRISLSAGLEPHEAIAKAKQDHINRAQTKVTRLLNNYLYGPYSDFQSTKAHNGKHTINIIASAFSDFLDFEMDKLTATDIVNWIKTYGVKESDKQGTSTQYKSASTLERAFGALKTLLRKAIKDNVIEQSPLIELSIHTLIPHQNKSGLVNEKQKRRILSDLEIKKIHQGLDLFADMIVFKRANSRNHGKAYLPDLGQLNFPHWFIPFTLVAMNTGMRPGDIYELKWNNIDFDNGIIRFTPQKTRHHMSPTEVILPLTVRLGDILDTWKKQCSPEHDIEFIFTNPKTCKRYNKDAHKKPWTRVKSLAELDPETDFYTFRHNFISQLVKSGTPLFTVAKLVGHKGTKMIEKYYGHLCQHEAKSAIEMISKSLNI